MTHTRRYNHANSGYYLDDTNTLENGYRAFITWVKNEMSQRYAADAILHLFQ